jgi:hypothetical protein
MVNNTILEGDHPSNSWTKFDFIPSNGSEEADFQRFPVFNQSKAITTICRTRCPDTTWFWKRTIQGVSQPSLVQYDPVISFPWSNNLLYLWQVSLISSVSPLLYNLGSPYLTIKGKCRPEHFCWVFVIRRVFSLYCPWTRVHHIWSAHRWWRVHVHIYAYVTLTK